MPVPPQLTLFPIAEETKSRESLPQLKRFQRSPEPLPLYQRSKTTLCLPCQTQSAWSNYAISR
ncbi:MAG TPA: hypothetical protein V6C65_27540 [Allocoleopsis sp.]